MIHQGNVSTSTTTPTSVTTDDLIGLDVNVTNQKLVGSDDLIFTGKITFNKNIDNISETIPEFNLILNNGENIKGIYWDYNTPKYKSGVP
ncbi:MAG: hypothetical protein LBV42_02400 [Methanobrevibacter sp.]|jgi:hypothetical protein|nr:hypothetical protein [Methanobrevibacter sp.]